MRRGYPGYSLVGFWLSATLGAAAVISCGSPTKPTPMPDATATAGSGGSGGTGGSSTLDTKTPCQEAYGERCGAACTGDTACGTGLHCQDAVCTAECIQASDCGNGQCTDDGRCDDISLKPIETDPTSNVDPPKCIEGQVEFNAVVPQVWLLLDRSGSMSSGFETTTRWAAIGNVLLGDPAVPTDHGVVGEFEDRVAFAAVFYTTGSGAGCVLALESVALAANNYNHIRQRYNKLGPSGGTPTADSIAATVAIAASSDLTGGPKLLVLATDGEPGGCSPRAGTPTLEVENEVDKAFRKKIQTFAISIASETDVAHMQRVANIGVGMAADATPPAKLYSGASTVELRDAFDKILTGVPRSCVFALNGRVAIARADEGTVELAGEELVYGDENGWRLKQADQVELVGEACEKIRAGEDDVEISFPCAVFTPVVK